MEGITVDLSADADCGAGPGQVLWRGEAAAGSEGALREGGASEGTNPLALLPPVWPSLDDRIPNGCVPELRLARERKRERRKGKGKEKGKESPCPSRPMARGGAPAGAMCGDMTDLHYS